jgi:hypothetical protein
MIESHARDTTRAMTRHVQEAKSETKRFLVSASGIQQENLSFVGETFRLPLHSARRRKRPVATYRHATAK